MATNLLADPDVLAVVSNFHDITERKQAEAALERSERRFRALIENGSDGIMLTSADRTVLYASPSFARILGYTPEELVGQKAFRFYHPEDVARLEDLRAGLLRAPGCRVFYETRGRHKDGSYRWIEAVAQNLLEDPSVQAVVNNVRDVTERKQAEETRAWLAAIVESSDAAIFSKTLDGVIQTWNLGAEKIYGYAAEEMVGRHVSVLAPPDRTDEVEEILGRIKRGQSVDQFRTVRLKKDGTPIHVSLTVSPVRDASGAIVAASTVARDITERVRLYEETGRRLRQLQALRDIDAAIRGSLDLRVTLNILLEKVTTHLQVDAACVLLADPGTQTLSYTAGRGFRTRALEGMSLRVGEGYAGRAALERRVFEVADIRLLRDDVVRASGIGQEDFIAYGAAPLIVKGEVKGILEIFHRGHRSPDSELLDYFETLAGQAAIAIDNAALFTDLQRSNADLARAYETAVEGSSRVIDERDRISRDLHDSTLQSLYGVNLAIEHAIALVDQDADEAKRRLAATLDLHNRVIQEIRQHIYNLRGPEAAERSFGAALEAVAAQFRRCANVPITLDVPDAMPALAAETRTQLLLLVHEALANAIRHAGASAVTVTADPGDHILRLRVRDNGRGFDSGSPSPRRGLGLRSMAERARSIGGRLDIRSAPGEGTVVDLSLPWPNGETQEVERAAKAAKQRLA